MSHPGHRLDIQGLRGIAVLIVVLFHARLTGFSGGFVGVDIFFVISGYVIGSSMLREIDRSGTIRLRSFWIRRARRLIPAFALMMATTLVAGVVMLQLGPVQDQAASTALAGIFSVANLHLNSSGGSYFGAAEEMNPFLHLWSLGVEEQFYLVLPIIVICAVAASRRTRWSAVSILVVALSTLSVASLLWSQRLLSAFDARGAFYLPTSRFWEMAAGYCSLSSLDGSPVIRSSLSAL